MASYPFLSNEWIEEVRKIREEYRGQGEPTGDAVRMNQLITDVPFGEGVMQAHLDTTSGEVEMDLGHLDAPDVTLTLDYASARDIFVNQDRDAAMQAFMAGKIKVQGDMTKLLTMLQAPVEPQAAELAERIKDLTD
ncbi:MAG: SCP2 sterol-binding domain-containing protein [Acidimicrobiia bacterium]|jgi:putative sterol carrier protein|nr:SCP2 sterol-binding domain-containing protein [Acidimicrobiia bacterium]MBA3955284.1 SCP2 sterol-binding domain-containing protein [Acidimicrobiia bacterium]